MNIPTPPYSPVANRRLSQVECIGCGAEPGEECAPWCDTDCRACADEAEGWYGKPHTCEDGPW